MRVAQRNLCRYSLKGSRQAKGSGLSIHADRLYSREINTEPPICAHCLISHRELFAWGVPVEWPVGVHVVTLALLSVGAISKAKLVFSRTVQIGLGCGKM